MKIKITKTELILTQKLCLFMEWLMSLINIELILTCKICRNGFNADNYVNHMQYHIKRGEKE